MGAFIYTKKTPFGGLRMAEWGGHAFMCAFILSISMFTATIL